MAFFSAVVLSAAVTLERGDVERRRAEQTLDKERSLLAALEVGCTAPVGALAEVAEGDDGQLEVFLRGSVTAIDGSDACLRFQLHDDGRSLSG